MFLGSGCIFLHYSSRSLCNFVFSSSHSLHSFGWRKYIFLSVVRLSCPLLSLMNANASLSGLLVFWSNTVSMYFHSLVPVLLLIWSWRCSIVFLLLSFGRCLLFYSLLFLCEVTHVCSRPHAVHCWPAFHACSFSPLN